MSSHRTVEPGVPPSETRPTSLVMTAQHAPCECRQYQNMGWCIVRMIKRPLITWNEHAQRPGIHPRQLDGWVHVNGQMTYFQGYCLFLIEKTCNLTGKILKLSAGAPAHVVTTKRGHKDKNKSISRVAKKACVHRHVAGINSMTAKVKRRRR